MVSNPNTQEAEIQNRSVKFGINSVHTQELPSNNKMEATNQQTRLPIFSNNYRNDKLTATQWIQEVTKLKTKAAWTNFQTLTQIQKAFKGELTDWFFSLKLLGIDTSDYESVKTAFENDYKVINSSEIESKISHPFNQAEEDGFTTVRNNKNKQTCKYCKKQGHSKSNCWTLKKKNKMRAEQSRTNQQHTNTNSNHTNNYICPISNSQEVTSDPQTQQETPEINKQKVETNTSVKDTKSNSIFSLIRKTCIKLMCEKIIKINDVRSKQTSRPLIQLKTLPGMNQPWLYDTGAALTCTSTETFRQIAMNSRPTKSPGLLTIEYMHGLSLLISSIGISLIRPTLHL